MENTAKDLDRLGLFAQAIIFEISAGNEESVDKIVEEMGKKNVVHYLMDKYQDNWLFSMREHCPYNIDGWEEVYSQYSYITENDARRKWGINNCNEGLLLLVTLTLEALRDVTH